MNNPYANEQETVDFRIGRSAAYTTIYLFLLLVTLPPLYRNLTEDFAPIRALFDKPPDQNIAAHLRSAEKKIEDAPFTDPIRRTVQTTLTRGPLNEGNSKTHIGKDGWLYFKTALDALSGYGPLKPEPDSVAKDPNRKPWKSPLAAITTFANQLAETDTELLLVPIPVKPMIYPEHLGIETDKPLTHPDAEALYSQITTLPNVDVLDLTETFWTEKSNTQLFLKRDTHWTPEGMTLAANVIFEKIKSDNVIETLRVRSSKTEIRSATGDLVEKLDIGHANFPDESVEVRPIPKINDIPAHTILLGDSFTNIYSDAVGLTWGAGAGLGDQLDLLLHGRLDVIAINGGGATEVRAALASRKGATTLMKDKKLVIWAIAARDLFLSETAANKARVEWEDITFDTRQPDPPKAPDSDIPPTTVRAKLVAKSQIDDPKTTAYTALLYAVEYELVETLSGEPPETEDGRFLALHWGFRDRELLPSASYEIGTERTMALVPFDTQSDIKTLEISNDSELFVDLLWEIPSGSTTVLAAAEPPESPALPASGCALYAALLGLALRRQSRAGLSH